MAPSIPTTNQSKSSIAIAHPAHGLLARSHPPELATSIFIDKIKNKPLLLTPTTNKANNATDGRALRQHIRAHKRRYFLQHQKPRPLSAKERRALRLDELPPAEVHYSIYRGLNGLWTSYILEVLGFTKDGALVEDADQRSIASNDQGSLLAAADFHGMEVEVVRCKDVGRVGTKGIVVRETKNTVVVVTSADQVKRILKRGTVLRVVVELSSHKYSFDPKAIAKLSTTASSTAPAFDADADTEAKANTGRSHTTTQQKQRQQTDSSTPALTNRKLVFDLQGSQLEVRPVDRATRKFKWHPPDHLRVR